MTRQNELGEFLRIRRAALRPQDVGIPVYGTRRVSGLRREELAMLAGVSTPYYTRLEQGLSTNASETVIDAIARALSLNADERAHLFNLAYRPKARQSVSGPDEVRAGTLQLINSLNCTPAVVVSRRSDVLAWNRIGHRLLACHLGFDSPWTPEERPNLTRLLFLDSHYRGLYTRWEEEAIRAVSSMRLVAGSASDDSELASLVKELTVKSKEFDDLWSRHPVENCMSGVKYMQHPDVGELVFDFEVLTPPDNSGHRVLMYTAAPGTRSAEALQFLAAKMGDGMEAAGKPAPVR